MTDPAGPSFRSRRPLSLSLLLILIVLGFLVWRSGRLGPPEVIFSDEAFLPVPVNAATVSPREGHFAPDFEVDTIRGRPVKLSALNGQAVFLNFWAPWCGPCRMEMSAIGRLASRAPKNVGIYTIAVGSGEEEVRRFMERLRVSFPVIHDAGGDLSARFEIAGIPTTLLVDQRGVVVKRIVGPRAWDHPEFLAWLSKLAHAGAQ